MRTAELNVPGILLQQLLECFTVYWLDQMRIESGSPGSGQISFTTPARQRDDAGTLPRPGVRTQALTDLEPVDVRHAEVEQDDVRIEVLRAFYRHAALECRGDLVAHRSQEPCDGARAVAIVVDDQHAPNRGGGGHGNDRHRPGWNHGAGSGRQAHNELAAPIGTGTARLDRSAMQFDKLPHQRETDSETAKRSWWSTRSLKELVERARPFDLGHADAHVGDGHLDVRSGGLGGQTNDSPSLGELRRIGQEIGEDLREANEVAVQVERLGRQRHDQLLIASLQQGIG